jgi:hypothetical protein
MRRLFIFTEGGQFLAWILPQSKKLRGTTYEQCQPRRHRPGSLPPVLPQQACHITDDARHSWLFLFCEGG